MATRIRHHDDILEWQWCAKHPLITSPKWTSSYLLDGLLIDTGCPKGVPDFIKWVKSLAKNNEIDQVYLTHFHEDHAGGVQAIQKLLDIPIYAPKNTYNLIKNQPKYRFYRRIYWGANKEKPNEFQSIPSVLSTTNKKYQFEPFPMPGHTQDLTALLDRSNQIVFVADAVIKRYSRIFGGNCLDTQEDIHQIYDSIKNLYDATKNCPNLRIFVSHDGVYPRSFLADRLMDIEKLYQKIKKIKESIPHTLHISKKQAINQILKKIWPKGDSKYIVWMTRGELTKNNLISSFIQWIESEL